MLCQFVSLPALLLILRYLQCPSRLFGSKGLDTMFKADFIQHLDLGSSPAGNSLLAFAVPHFFQSLGDTILNVLTTLVMPDRNVVDVQVRCCFVHVQDSVENVEVGIAFLKSLHILFQAIGNKLKILSAVSRILTLSDLHNVLIKALTFVGGSADSVAGLHTKKVFVVAAVNLAIVTLLFGIVTLGGFSKKLLVGFTNWLTHEGDVLRRA